MKIETLKNVLHWTAEFHRHLSEKMSQCATENESQRAVMLLDYLAMHEKKLSHVISQFEKTSSAGALSTWCYEFVEKSPALQKEYVDASFEELNAMQIMSVIVELHQQIIEFYRYLLSRADSTSAQELLQQLCALEEHEVMQMSHSANRLSDL